ncbi:MAG: DsbA family protein [Nanoarchaeota archaeon]|nr:DsbA family protein [Nanoarchaeota archaeon]
MEKNSRVLLIFAGVLVGVLLVVMIMSNPGGGDPNQIYDVDVGMYNGKGFGDIEIIEFSDFQCPACERIQPVVEEVLEVYGNDVKIYFRNFPLSIHENGFNSALAGACANEQGKFWEMHDKLYENQNNLDVDSLKSYAVELELNSEEFDSCLDDKKYEQEILKDLSDGRKANVKGTPTFYINGKKVSGVSFESFRGGIEGELGNSE